ncbi:MAG: hypothetical protein M3Q75_10900 [Gemmatimonadota bacterium]|nr:hypothetical protein [Gemmatimonadota bacterium]
MTNPVLERTITLAAEHAVRGRKQFTTAEDIRQELRVHLLLHSRLAEQEPAKLFSTLRWVGSTYAKRQQSECETGRGGPSTADRWAGLDGMSGYDAIAALIGAGYWGPQADIERIAQAVDCRMDWDHLGTAWGVSGKAAYTRFRRATDRVSETRTVQQKGATE